MKKKLIYSDMIYGVEKITSEDEQINLDFYYKLIENWYESENIYRIKEDGGRWCWDEYMFEKPQNSIRYLLHQKMEDVVNV